MSDETEQSGDYDLAPGNVLQNMYIKRRLNLYAGEARVFIEVGSGNGNSSHILLHAGLTGVGYDLSVEACENNARRNRTFIESGKYSIRNADFFEAVDSGQADVIFASHVIEHLPPDRVEAYFEKCKSLLNPGGRIVTLVPSNMKYWGIEDETAGHYRRYGFQDFEEIARKHDLTLDHIAGLTYPLSNILLGVSNCLLEKSEAWKKNLPKRQQTEMSSSGVRKVKYKTHFPRYFRYLINEWTLFPFYVMQVLSRKNENSLTLYCELSRRVASR